MSEALRTVVVDGLSVQTTDQGAQAIAKLLKDLESSVAKFNDATTSHQAALSAKDVEIANTGKAHEAAIATKDEEIGALKADLKTAQDAAPKVADLDKLVADRAVLVTTIKAIDAKIEISGRTDAELRREAVRAKLGDAMVKDASDAEISGMFKAIAKDVKAADPFRQVVQNGIPTADGATNSNDAYAAMLVRDANAWQGNKETV